MTSPALCAGACPSARVRDQGPKSPTAVPVRPPLDLYISTPKLTNPQSSRLIHESSDTRTTINRAINLANSRITIETMSRHLIRPVHRLRRPHHLRHISRLSPFQAPPPFPVLSTCPAPTCPCAPTPSDLDIDRTTPLNGTAPAYSQHLLLSTGHADWPSRIEDDTTDAAVSGFRTLLGRTGKYFDVSFSSSPPPVFLLLFRSELVYYTGDMTKHFLCSRTIKSSSQILP